MTAGDWQAQVQTILDRQDQAFEKHLAEKRAAEIAAFAQDGDAGKLGQFIEDELAEMLWYEIVARGVPLPGDFPGLPALHDDLPAG